MWICAYSRGISSAREIERQCAYEPGLQWLTGLQPVIHHTLSDMLTRLLLYGYATGLTSSRRIEKAPCDQILLRFLSADQHRDHDTITHFRR